MNELPNADVESGNVPPPRHDLQGDERATFPIDHEGAEFEDDSEFSDLGCEFVELQVPCSVF